MASDERIVQELTFNFADGETLSQALSAGAGVMGSVIVPAGSDLIGKTVQFVAHSPGGKYADADLFSTPKTLAAGSNTLTEEEILEAGFVNVLKLKLNSAVGADSSCVLVWKS